MKGTTKKSKTTDFNTLIEDSLAKYQYLKPGQIVEGTITGKSPKALIVDVGTKSEGVISGRELKTDLVDLSKVKVGDPILVYVITPESRTGELMLSLRRTEEMRVWFELEKAQTNNEPVKVTIVEANSGGVIGELSAGIRGFIPISQLDPARIFDEGNRVSGKDISAIIQKKLTRLLGEVLEAQIMELDREKMRVILSEKKVIMGASGETMLTAHDVKPGDILDAQVTAVFPYGIFVNAAGVEGLVHISELSWDKVSDVSSLYVVGDKIKVKVLLVGDGGKRVAYSIKQLSEDPWKEMIKNYKVNDIVEGTVDKVVEYGAFVRIDKGINGLIHISELSDKLVRDPHDIVQPGQDVKVMILSISENERHLGLSLKRVKGEVVTKKPKAAKAEKPAKVEKTAKATKTVKKAVAKKAPAKKAKAALVEKKPKTTKKTAKKTK